MRVMINKEKTKVLFAEVGSDLADILLSFLTLPLGTIVKLLKKHYGDEAPVFGSLTTLHTGLVNLDSSHFCTEVAKDMLLNPRNAYDAQCRKLKLNIDDTHPARYFVCRTVDCLYFRIYVGIYHDTARCMCGKSINREVSLKENCEYDLGFTKKDVSFFVTEDLRIFPNTRTSLLQSLDNLGITTIEGAEDRTVVVGLNEIMALLKGSLFSHTPLSDLILNKSQVCQYEPFVRMPYVKKGISFRSKKMVVKAVMQKSKNKLLFAQVEEDFVDFLFSLLTIPLGKVEHLVQNETFLGSIDNLYRSVAKLNADMYLKNSDTKNMILNPMLPPKYLSDKQFFPLTERNLKFVVVSSSVCDSFTIQSNDFNDPKVMGSYLKGKSKFTVTDDLTITPLCMFSSTTFLNRQSVTLSDVEEVEFSVGVEEAFSILRASLTTTHALTNGLNIEQWALGLELPNSKESHSSKLLWNISSSKSCCWFLKCFGYLLDM